MQNQSKRSYWSTNCHDAYLWSESHFYPSFISNRYPAIYVRYKDASKIVHCNFSSKNIFLYPLLNNKTIILLNLEEYCLILANLIRRIIVKYSSEDRSILHANVMRYYTLITKVAFFSFFLPYRSVEVFVLHSS